jgi:AraC-like DNA-binding protein
MAPVLFGQPGTSLALPVDLAEKTLPCGNEEVAEVNEQLMSKYLASLDSGHLVKRVKRTIVQHLPSGAANLENVARQLYLSPRTLQRHLRREGTTFAAVLDETRQELARQYLKERGVDLTDVAFLLGFSQRSSFSRSFKRWTGGSPASYRQAA